MTCTKPYTDYIHVYIYIYIHSMHVCMYVCIYIYIYTYVYVYTYMYVYKCIHTYAYALTMCCWWQHTYAQYILSLYVHAYACSQAYIIQVYALTCACTCFMRRTRTIKLQPYQTIMLKTGSERLTTHHRVDADVCGINTHPTYLSFQIPPSPSRSMSRTHAEVECDRTSR